MADTEKTQTPERDGDVNSESDWSQRTLEANRSPRGQGGELHLGPLEEVWSGV